MEQRKFVKATEREFDNFLYEFQEKEEIKKEEKKIRVEIKEEKRLKCLEQQKRKRKTRNQEEKEVEKELAELLIIPLNCPNEICENHLHPKDKWFSKSGTFTQKWSNKAIQKFRCKLCGNTFSSSTFTDHYRQQKPYLNSKICGLVT